jgi:hypothetical protein
MLRPLQFAVRARVARRRKPLFRASDAGRARRNDAPLNESFLTAFAEARAGAHRIAGAAFDVASDNAALRFDLVWIITTRLHDDLSSFVEQLGPHSQVRIAFVDESSNVNEEPMRLAGAPVERIAISPQTNWPLALERTLERFSQRRAARVSSSFFRRRKSSSEFAILVGT